MTIELQLLTDIQQLLTFTPRFPYPLPILTTHHSGVSNQLISFMAAEGQSRVDGHRGHIHDHVIHEWRQVCALCWNNDTQVTLFCHYTNGSSGKEFCK